MADINELITQFNVCKNDINRLKTMSCMCVSVSSDVLFNIEGEDLTLQKINNFVATIPIECQHCVEYKEAMTTYQTLKGQLTDYIDNL